MQSTLRATLTFVAVTPFVFLGTVLGGCASSTPRSTPQTSATEAHHNMHLGAFSVSLAVKDIAASTAFYEKLGFVPAGGDPAQNWQIMRNGDHVIGLFQGMFPTNIMTFNPGWTQQAEAIDGDFKDVRDVQAALKAKGVTLTTEADASTTGPASLTLVDPDGNVILIDQHVAKR